MLSVVEQERLRKLVAEDNDRLVAIFDALGDANRCQLFRLIAGKPGINVSEAAKTLGLSLPLASQHFKILDQSQLVIKEKKGREVHYRANDKDPMVNAIIKVITT